MRICRAFLTAAALLSVVSSIAMERTTPLTGTPAERLVEVATRDGVVRLIIGIRDEAWQPEGKLGSSDAIKAQRKRWKDVLRKVKRKNGTINAVPGWEFETIPAFVADADLEGLRLLMADDDVVSLEEDVEGKLQLAQSVPKIGATTAHARQPVPYRGSGQIVVVIDGGVDDSHPFFGTPTRIRASDGACFSGEKITDGGDPAGTYRSLCPGGVTRAYGAAAGRPCTIGNLSSQINQCHHGTRVAGIAASADATYTGVAPEAQIIPIQVLSKTNCAANAPDSDCGTSGLKSSVILALDYVASTIVPQHGRALAAINLSITFPLSGLQSTACDGTNTMLRNAVANVVSHDIAVIVATANNSSTTQIGVPACLSNVIAVSATDDDDIDHVAPYANVADMVDLFAPGGAQGAGLGITSSQNTGCQNCGQTFEDAGTSLAAPHVAASFALLRERYPSASIQSLLGMLTRTGPMITDTRSDPPTVTRPRINVNEALDQPVTLPSPTGLVATAIAPGTVQISWNAPNPAIARTSYRLRFRTTLTGTWTELANTTLTSHAHGGLIGGTVYQYEVATNDIAGNVSGSVSDYAMTLFFTDDPVNTGSTIRGIHVGELRQAADAWRAFAGLAPAFGSYSPATGIVLATDLTSLVTAVNAARIQIGLSAFEYAVVAAPDAGVVVDHRHVQQLRDVMR